MDSQAPQWRRMWLVLATLLALILMIVALVLPAWLPLIEAAATPGLVIGAAAALLYLWWRLR